MLNCLLVGGTGGLGKQLIPLLGDFMEVTSVGSVFDITTLSSNISLHYDVVINLATVNYDALLNKYSDEQIDKMLSVNIQGNINLMRAAINFMRKNEFGRLIYISSILADQPLKGTAIYAAGKSFNETLMRTIALENANTGITSNVIQLGYFEGGLTEKVPIPILEKALEKVPLKRLGKAQEIANAIKFIVETEYFTGSVLRLNGGL